MTTYRFWLEETREREVVLDLTDEEVDTVRVASPRYRTKALQELIETHEDDVVLGDWEQLDLSCRRVP